MTPTHISTLSHCKPPHTDHSPITLSQVVVLVQSLSYMTVAIVTFNHVRGYAKILPANVVHSLFVYLVSLSHRLVVFLGLINVQHYVPNA